ARSELSGPCSPPIMHLTAADILGCSDCCHLSLALFSPSSDTTCCNLDDDLLGGCFLPSYLTGRCRRWTSLSQKSAKIWSNLE
ncbi:Hypothetical predicted protein, partial [Pelobates cultripes]